MNAEKEYPQGFLNRMQKMLGKDFSEFLNFLETSPSISIRLNPFKPANKIENHEKVPWAQEGYYLSERPKFTLDPLFHAGVYYVQEASSMFLEKVIKQITTPEKPLKVLDLCASPGGKTTHLAALLNTDSLIVANETIRSRLPALEENVIRWGCSNIIITNNDPADFTALKDFFDIVLVDAPCSGEGLFRRNPEAVSEWSESNINLCSLRQKRILDDVFPVLKPGGYLIYSTCTWTEAENEQQIKQLTDSGAYSPVKIKTNREWNVEEPEIKEENNTGWGYRFYPHKIKGEGFFISCLKKAGEELTRNNGFRKIKTNQLLPDKKHFLFSKYLNDIQKSIFTEDHGEIIAVPETLFNDIFFLKEKLRVVKYGVKVGKPAGNEIIPSHELALSLLVSHEFNSVELSREQAVKYLKKQEIETSPGTPLGWTLVKYQGHPMGWIKCLPNRINNYYPKQFRIRMH